MVHETRKLFEELQLTEQGHINPTGGHVTLWDDFTGGALSGWATTVEADGTAQSTIAPAAGASGIAKISLGAVANDFGNLASGLFVSTAKAGKLVVRLKVSGSPDNLFVGISDAQTESNGEISDDLSTPALVPTDGAFFGYEVANGGDNWYICAANDGTDVATALTQTVSTSYQVLTIEWTDNGDLTFSIDGDVVGTIIDGILNDKTLCVIIASTNVAGTITPDIDIDYVYLTQERT